MLDMFKGLNLDGPTLLVAMRFVQKAKATGNASAFIKQWMEKALEDGEEPPARPPEVRAKATVINQNPLGRGRK